MNVSSPPPFDSVGAAEVQGAFAQLDDGAIVGYAFAPGDPTLRLVVELVVDGLPTQLARADLFHSELHKLRIGDGCYGFHIVAPAAQLLVAREIMVRIANSHEPLAREPDAPLPSVVPAATPGGVEWIGALRFRGWVPASAERPMVAVSVDGEAIAEVHADAWTLASVDGVTRPARGFYLLLPEQLADGRLHRAHFELNGQPLRGAPLPFIAFPDGLRHHLEALLPAGELERAELFDALLPQVRGFHDYARWAEEALELPTTAGPDAPAMQLGIVVLGDEGIEATIGSLTADASSWVGGALASDEAQAGFPLAALATFLAEDGRACEAFVFVAAGTQLRAGALDRIRAAFAGFPDASMVGCDVDVREADGSIWPLAFPAEDYERTLEQGYWARLFAVRRDAVSALIAAGIDNVFRIANSLYDGEAPGKLAHLPGAAGTVPAECLKKGGLALRAATAAHLDAIGQRAKLGAVQADTLPRLRVARATPREPVTLILDTCSYPDIAGQVLGALEPALRTRQAQLIVLAPARGSTGQRDPEPLIQAPGNAHTVAVTPGRRVAAMNAAFATAREGAICFVGGAVVPEDGTWLDELLSRLAGPRIGAVSPVLHYEGGSVAQAGLVLGPRLDAVPAFDQLGRADPGYGDLMMVAHEVGALDGRCFAMRASTWRQIGPLDELRFPFFLHGIDLSLRLRQAGLRLVVTPHARMSDLAGPIELTSGRVAQRDRELRALRTRWGDALANDPYYNPILARDGVPYSGLAWPARELSPRCLRPPKSSEIPAGV